MFHKAFNFNQPIGNWDVSKVISFSSTFKSVSAFAQDLSTWTGSGAETLQSYVFNETTAFKVK